MSAPWRCLSVKPHPAHDVLMGGQLVPCIGREHTAISVHERRTGIDWDKVKLDAEVVDNMPYLPMLMEGFERMDTARFLTDNLRRQEELPSWITKDSGERQQYASGMVRDTEEGKPRFDLLRPLGIPYQEQMLTRFAELLARGAEKYGDRNWEKARGQEELNRYHSSAARHFEQWLAGEFDEDHAAAVMFNLMAAETVKYHMTMEEE